jgi:dipeptidyl aminopeptidase/acylaminoacyl peptidase
VASAALRLGGVTLDGDDIYWVEGRPEESGRHVLVRRTADGRIADATPAGTNVRTRVHEYGGAAHAVASRTIYYVEFTDQRLYKLTPDAAPVPLTPPGGYFYADIAVDQLRGRIISVREDHSDEGREAVATLVSLPISGPPSSGQIIVSGHDFYSTPRLSPDGSQLVWLAWRHPQMPWDGTELWLAELASDGSLERSRRIAGGDDESIFQPGWAPDGTLYFVSDRTGWWNLYRFHDGVEPVCAMEADFGRPQWALGTNTWSAAGSSQLVVTYAEQGRWHLATIDRSTHRLAQVPTDVEPADSIAATSTHAVLLGGSMAAPDAIMRIDLRSGGVETLRAAASVRIGSGFLSAPAAIEFPTGGGLTAHAFHYAPQNAEFTASAGERPPLIVISHGGPTGAANARLNLEVQYWTSRGFAVVDVNYGGSTGYGRSYRRRLRGQWGIVDVADCVNAAKSLVAAGKADGNRLIIRGRSAGGFTTLAALAFHPSQFRAGASYYGVCDLELLARETHKFESRYLDTLIAPYPVEVNVYRARSPIHSIDRLSCPLILFQGLEDRVVPPSQSRLMYEAVRDKHLPVALLTFAGEQHGFRKAETIASCLAAELSFYGAVFGFAPAEDHRTFAIDNLDRWQSASTAAARTHDN